MADDISVLQGILAQYSGGGAPVPGAGPTSQPYWAGTSTTKAANKTYTVYMGTTPNGYDVGRSEPTRGSDKTMTESQAIAQFHDWSQQDLIKWRDLLIKDGIIKPTKVSYTDLQSEWTKAVQGAAQAYTIGGKKVTPFSMVDLMATVNGTNGMAPLPTTQTSTSTDSQVQDVDPAAARGAIDSAFSQLLGRMPTNDERQQFFQQAQAQSATMPATNTTTRTTSGTSNAAGNNTSQSSTSTAHGSPGYTSADMTQQAQDQAQSDPHYAEYQSATTLFDWIQQAIRGGG